MFQPLIGVLATQTALTHRQNMMHRSHHLPKMLEEKVKDNHKGSQKAYSRNPTELSCNLFSKINNKQDCIPVGCAAPACCPYLPACTAQGRAACSRKGCLLLGVSTPGAICLFQGGVFVAGGKNANMPTLCITEKLERDYGIR